MTLNEAFEIYIDGRKDLRQSTVIVYKNTFRHATGIGDSEIADIKFSDVKKLYTELRYDKGLKPRTIELLNSILHPIFTEALRDQLISYNPVSGALHEIARGDNWRKDNKRALTVDEQKRFMEFVRNSPRFKRWENLFIFLLGTGCRVGEAIGLRWENVDFSNGIITIDHSTTYYSGEMREGPTKTAASNRIIPMLSEVKRALKNEQRVQKVMFPICSNNIPGKCGYVFRNSRGGLHIPSTINQAIDNIVKAYNKQNPECPLPHFSVHQLRHTFCTRLCEQEANVKLIQCVMGHSDFKTTMDVYASISDEKKKLSFAKIDKKIIVH